jgi:hypothetical protein
MGGTCSKGVRPYEFSLKDLEDLRIGDTKQMDKGCGPDLDTNEKYLKDQGFKWPDNGEFEYGGRGGDCNMCSLVEGYGCECHGSGEYVGGKRGKVKRVEYKADPTECCFANVERKDAIKTIGNLTCDPKYRDPGGTDCTNIYSDYCKVGDRMMTDAKCKALENSNITLYNTLMKDKCNLDQFYQSTACIDWCKNNSTQCTKLNTLQDCRKYGISVSDCTPQRVLEVETDCKKYGIRSEQGLTVSQCSVAGIKAVTDQCKEYNILDICTANTLQDAIDNAVQAATLDVAVKTQEQIQKNYDTTQQTISDILNLTEEPSTTFAPITIATPPPTSAPFSMSTLGDFDINNIGEWIKENYIITIIIVAIIFLIISSSSSLMLLVVVKK